MTADVLAAENTRLRSALARIRDAARIPWTRGPSADACTVADIAAEALSTAPVPYTPTEAGRLAEAYSSLVADLETLHEAWPWSDGTLGCRHCDTFAEPDPRDRCATIRLVHGRP